MLMTLKNHTRAVFASALSLCAAGLALAGGTDYQIKYVPDFDQKRGAGPGIPGLPNNGGCYCMPTSAINWVAFLANRGYPQLAPPGNWQNADRYNIVTAALDDLGADMGTDPGGPDPNDPKNNLRCGTGGDEAKVALVAGFDALTPGKFVVTKMYAGGNYSPRYTTLVNAMLNGGLVLLRYGHYEEVIIPAQGAPAFVRDGGHIMSLTGVTGYDNPGVRIRFRNPSSDESPDNLIAQSTFSTEDTSVQNVQAIFANDDEMVERIQTRLPDISSNPKFIDGYIQIKPVFGLSVCCGSLQMNTMNPVPPIHGNPPQNVNVTSPSGTPILDVEIHPELDRVYAITAGAAGGGPPRIFLVLPTSGPAIMDLTAPTSMTSGRKGELYVLDGSMLRVINPDLPSPQIGAVSIPGAPIAGRIDYDDDTDEVVGVSPTSNEVVRIKWTPAGSTIVRKAKPPGASTPGLMVACAKGKVFGRVWLTSSNATSIYGIEPDTTGTLQIVEQINLVPVLAGGPITNDALHVDSREHVLLARGGIIMEFEKVGGIWMEAANSVFAGLPIGSHMRIATSRSNFDPAIMSGPAQLDVLPTDPETEVADCVCDIAPSPLGDGVVGIQDLLRVIATWGPCAGTPENCLGDVAPENIGNQQVNIQDLLMVIARWGPCP